MSRNAAHGDGRGRNSQSFQVCPCFPSSDEIVIGGRAEPHAVDFKIGYYGDDSSARPPFAPFAVEQRRGQEMRADGDIRIELANLLEKLSSTDPLNLPLKRI